VRNLELLSQNDPRWQNIHLGTSPTVTLGQAGCLVTSFCVLAEYYGIPILPDAMNQRLINANLFADSDLVSNDEDLHELFPDIQYIESVHSEKIPADLNLLKAFLSDPTQSVILEIDLGNGQVHYTPAVDSDGISVSIMNVWDGRVEDLKLTYGDPATVILKYIVYKGLPKSMDQTTTVIEIDQADFLKLRQKSESLDKLGEYLGFDQPTIDSLGFSDQAIAKVESLKNSASPTPAPDTITNENSTPEQPLTPTQQNIVFKFLGLLGFKLQS